MKLRLQWKAPTGHGDGCWRSISSSGIRDCLHGHSRFAASRAYMHLLVTYHFGFIRRAFVGTVVSGFTDAVPFWYSMRSALAAWVVTGPLFVSAFRKVFGFKAKNFPLFVFMFGSPFFLRNFAVSIGHFDIYGCLWAFVALLMPVGRDLSAAHRRRMRLPDPDSPSAFFAVSADDRLHRLRPLRRGRVFRPEGRLRLRLSLFWWRCSSRPHSSGSVPVPPETFIAYVRARASSSSTRKTPWMWYSTTRPGDQIHLGPLRHERHPHAGLCGVDRPALSGGALFRIPDRRAADAHAPACHDRSDLAE